MTDDRDAQSVCSGPRTFDYQARKHYGISGNEWLRRYDAGEFAGQDICADGHRLAGMLMLLPLVRRIPVPEGDE